MPQYTNVESYTIYLQVRTPFDEHFCALFNVWPKEITDIERLCSELKRFQILE